MKICVFTLGCKVNKYESNAMMTLLAQNGHEVTDSLTEADAYIINTCAVTAEAEKKSRQCIARVKRLNPNAKILICGCASQNNATQFMRDGVIYISGTARKDILASLPNGGERVLPLPKKYEELGRAKQTRTRAYIKIQDGCNRFCSYCLIPYVRGRSRSREISEIVDEATASHAQEIVLTGVDISDFGWDTGSSLLELVSALKEIPARIRFGSFEAGIVDESLLFALKDLKSFSPHFHLSLQSGSDEVLKSMNRHYTTTEFMERVQLILKYFPLAGITTDVIAGFPTEGEQEFAQSLEFIESVGFSDIHCFPYSPRKGTAAYKLGRLSDEVVNSRMEKLLAVKKKLQVEFVKKNIGVPHEVLFEEVIEGYAVGYTQNYLRFYKKGASPGAIEKVVGHAPYLDGIK